MTSTFIGRVGRLGMLMLLGAAIGFGRVMDCVRVISGMDA